MPSEQHESAVGSQAREIPHEDTDADELRYVQHVINDLGKANKELILETSLRVIRKFYKVADGQPITIWSLILNRHELEFDIRYNGSPGSHHICKVKVRPIHGSNARAPGTSSFAWLSLSIDQTSITVMLTDALTSANDGQT
ncbi:MAG: hypothetical protein Q9171_005915 [Xanthocarpia ochracea]